MKTSIITEGKILFLFESLLNQQQIKYTSAIHELHSIIGRLQAQDEIPQEIHALISVTS